MIKIIHYRVPAEDVENERLVGEPDPNSLFPYSRRYGFAGNVDHAPHVRGGATFLRVRSRYREHWAEATCSMSENFSYAGGRQRAAVRLIKQLLVDQAQVSEEDAVALIEMIYDGERFNY